MYTTAALFLPHHTTETTTLPIPIPIRLPPESHHVQTSGPLFCRPLFGRSRGTGWQLSVHYTLCIFHSTGGPSNTMCMQPVLNTFFQPLSVERIERDASRSTFLVRVNLRFLSFQSFTCTAGNPCRAKVLYSPS